MGQRSQRLISVETFKISGLNQGWENLPGFVDLNWPSETLLREHIPTWDSITLALWHCCMVALLHCCTVALLHCCIVALLLHCLWRVLIGKMQFLASLSLLPLSPHHRVLPISVVRPETNAWRIDQFLQNEQGRSKGGIENQQLFRGFQ